MSSFESTSLNQEMPDADSFLENLPDGVIFLDREWRITYANASARTISRMRPEDLNGPSHWELYPATVGTAQETIYRRSMNARLSLDHEFYYAPFEIWIKLKTMPIPSGIAVYYQDVTPLKVAETARDGSDFRLQQVFEATTDGVVQLDHGFNFTFINRRAREVLAPSGNVLGTNLWTSFPDTIYPGSPYVEVFNRVVREGAAESFEAFYPEPLNLWFRLDVRPSDGGLIIFFRDVTEERAAAAELLQKTEEAERQAAEIEAMYRTAPIGLALFDVEDFRYVRLNDRQAAFFGLKPEQIVGRTLTEMAPIEGLRELFEQVRDGAPVVNHPLEGELISHPGEHRHWTVNYFPVYGADGEIQGISAASLEVTQQKKAERALIQSEKLAAVGRLASSISHEINNPLESVTNLLYLIATSPELPPSLKNYVDLTQSEVSRVSQIATQTLRFHRQSSRPTQVTAATLIEPVMNLFRGRLLNSGISLEESLNAPLAVQCMENEIRQVLSNLIANAIDAMRSGGRLLLRARAMADAKTGETGLRITVADTGHGMSRETLTRLFEPFFTTKDLNGTGLGLWISAEIVQRHHGRLTVRSSQRTGQSGTVFTLFLPANQAQDPIESK